MSIENVKPVEEVFYPEGKNASVPMIWTKRGNLPLSELKYEVSWERAESYLKFIERHFDKRDGELVREAAHVYALKPVFDMNAETARLNS